MFGSQNIPGIKLWLAADAGVVLTSGAVSQWSDLSGNNFNLTQNTANSRPLLVNNVLNSKPVLRFDGNNDFMSVNFGQVLAQPLTIFIVHKCIGGSTSAPYLYDNYINPGTAIGNSNAICAALLYSARVLFIWCGWSRRQGR